MIKKFYGGSDVIEIIIMDSVNRFDPVTLGDGSFHIFDTAFENIWTTEKVVGFGSGSVKTESDFVDKGG